jgi:periplasmic protein TonB
MVPEEKMSGVTLGAFALVLAAHMALFTMLTQQNMTLSTHHPVPAKTGDVRVRLVSNKTEAVAPQQVAPPPKPPQAEKKILSSEAPSQRVVEAPKPQAAPVLPNAAPPRDPVPPAPAQAPAPQVVAVAQTAAAAPSPLVAATKSDMLDTSKVPKQVGQLDCRVPKPDYPRAARRRGETGTAIIRLTVDERGQVSATLERSSGFPDLDVSARQAAQSAQCKPYVEAGQPIRVTAIQPFNFVPADD